MNDHLQRFFKKTEPRSVYEAAEAAVRILAAQAGIPQRRTGRRPVLHCLSQKAFTVCHSILKVCHYCYFQYFVFNISFCFKTSKYFVTIVFNTFFQYFLSTGSSSQRIETTRLKIETSKNAINAIDEKFLKKKRTEK